MTTKINLCAFCSEKLKEYHLHIWEQVCCYKGVYKRVFKMRMDDEAKVDEIIRDLENDGFIISTETENGETLAIVPACEYHFFNGSEEEVFYCAKIKQHLEVIDE